MRRVVITTLSTVTGIVLLLSLKPHGGDQTTAGSAPRSGSGQSSSGSGGSSPGTGSTGSAKSGTFTGDPVDTRYGPVQVAVTLEDGRITAVEAVQLPSGNPRDEEISAYAVPQLTQDALDAQSAGIDTVTGATYTSEGYIQSLQSALDQSRG
ncbi:FMN-binding protein [Streptomyces sp. NPDC051940]|uniref:FMN-binding protein n=1 Tax=Streptomyces sp. NPDC051940 TaxID=3155675 RepID=UPI0034414BF0